MASMKLEAKEGNFVAGLERASGAVGKLAGTINNKLVDQFNKADFYSRKFEKGIGRIADTMRDAGMAMTIGITLPVGLMVKNLSDAYAELDSLKRALATVTPSNQMLNRLQELQQIAKQPGIGFAEAIQGAVRLQSVGISASTTTKILKEFANAIAMTGGGKAQLNEVTVQLGQMAAKGKVLSQDLRPIIEAAPAVAAALKNLFGTVSSDLIADQLEKQGKSATDMINMLVAELEKAPRVTGGWKNSLENLSDTLFRAKADIFEVADKVFNLSQKLQDLTDFISKSVEAFKSLPESVQKTTLGLIALLAVTGPVLVGLGAIAKVATTLLTPALMGMIAPTTAVIGLLGLLAFAYIDVVSKQNELAKATESISDINARINNQYSAQTSRINELVSVLKNQKSSTDDVKKAKDELIKIDPSFASALKGEKVNFDKLNISVKDYISNLTKAAKAKELQAKIESNIALENAIYSDPTRTMNVFDVINNGATRLLEGRDAANLRIAQRNAKTIIDLRKANEEYANELRNIGTITEPTQGNGGTPPFSGKGSGSDEIKNAGYKRLEAFKKMHTEEMKERDKAYIERLKRGLEDDKQWAELLDASNLPKDPESTLKWDMADPGKLVGMSMPFLEGLADGQIKTSDQLNTDLDRSIQRNLEILKGWPTQIEQIRKDVQGMSIDLMSDLAVGLFSGDGLQSALKGALNAFGNYAIELGKKLLPIANIMKLLKLDPTNNGHLIALIAGGTALKMAAASINPPKFAEGGMVKNPVLAMMGDNPSGKEMALPFEKTGEFADMIARNLDGNSGGSFIASTRVAGDDLLVLVQRASRKQNNGSKILF